MGHGDNRFPLNALPPPCLKKPFFCWGWQSPLCHTAGVLSAISRFSKIEDFGADPRVAFQRARKGHLQNKTAQNTILDSSPNPDPDPAPIPKSTGSVLKKKRCSVFSSKFWLDHTRTLILFFLRKFGYIDHSRTLILKFYPNSIVCAYCCSCGSQFRDVEHARTSMGLSEAQHLPGAT